MEEEDAAEEAEEVGGEQREVDRRGAGHLHHDGHEAVECEHTQDVACKQRGCRTQRARGDTSTSEKNLQFNKTGSGLTNVNVPRYRGDLTGFQNRPATQGEHGEERLC